MSFRYDSTGIKENDFTPMPPGWYDLIIKFAEETVSKRGIPMVKVTASVTAPAEYRDRWIFHNVVFMSPDAPGAGINVHFRKCIGVPWEGNVDVNPREWAGKMFKAKLIIDEYNGQKNNKIKAVSPMQETVDEDDPFGA